MTVTGVIVIVTDVIVSDCYWYNSSVTGVIVTVTGVIVSDCY